MMMVIESLRNTARDVYTYRRVYILASVASFGGMLFGWDTGLIGGVLTMSAFQQSFGLKSGTLQYANLSGNIVSVLQAGCFFGAGASFFLSDFFGRKKTLFIAVFFFLLGSVIQTCSAIGTSSLGMLYAGRVIGGFGVGIISSTVPTYIGESANKEIRGRCIGMMQLFNVSGIMLSFFVNYGVSLHVHGGSKVWRIPFAIQMLPGVLLLVGMIFQPESPRWLVEKGRVEDARAVLAGLRSKHLQDDQVALELSEIVSDFKGKRLSFAQQLRAVTASKQVAYPVAMALWLQFWQQWSGTNSINYYAPQIFESIGLSSANAGLFATGIYGVVKVVFTGLALMLAVEQLGRKWCLIIGGTGQAFSMLYIGIHQAVSGSTPGPGTNFAIVCVYLYVVFYSLAWGFVPYILSSECSPNHVRALVMASALMLQWLCNFAIAKLFPIMLASITWGSYVVFGVACLLMVGYAVIFVPETKNIPLESIHLLFEGNRIVWHATQDVIPRLQRAHGLKDKHVIDEHVGAQVGLQDDEDGKTGSMHMETGDKW